jgi:aldose sugar dehydrogenase
MKRLLSLSATALAAAFPLHAQEIGPIETDHVTLEVATVAEGLEHPWGLAFLPDERLLVTERDPGTIRLVSADGSSSDVVHEIEDLFRYDGETERSQSGLFHITLHPDFDENGYVYWAYSRETERGAAVVVQRGVWTDDEAELGEIEDVWVMQEDD